MAKTSATSDTDTAFPPPEPSSSHSSPSRKPAHLFADYHPNTPGRNDARGFALPQSPSLPEFTALRGRGHARTNSDVQGLVKRFEHLDVRDKDAESAERKRRHEAELKRHVIAREEAESDVRRLREELRRMRKEGEDGRDRERRVGRRLEAVMEDYQSAKERYASQHSIYEKETRKAKKEAFKSSSAVLKLQEELKSTRNSLRVTQSGFDLEKQKVQRREQETFDAQYQLAAVQEELDKLRTHMRIVEEEKEALKTSLKEEEVARIAAEGMIALPAPKAGDDDDLLNSPRKSLSPRKRAESPLSDDKENMGVNPQKKLLMQTKKLEEELKMEAVRREHAEEMLEFLDLECKFQCCSCRSAANQGHQDGLEMSAELAATLAALKEGMMSVLGSSVETHEEAVEVEDQGTEQMDVDSKAAEQSEVLKDEHVAKVDFEKVAEKESDDASAGARENFPEDADRSMTLAPEDTPEGPAVDSEAPTAPRPTPAEVELQPQESGEPEETANEVADALHQTQSIPLRPSTPETPLQRVPSRHNQQAVRTITTTTTVPMHFTPVSKSHSHPYPNTSAIDDVEDQENIPPTHLSKASFSSAPGETTQDKKEPFDRAAALAAIEYRRGRARSFAAGHATPRKQMVEGVGPRRDISAPAFGGKSVGSGASSFGKGPGSVGRGGGRRMA